MLDTVELGNLKDNVIASWDAAWGWGRLDESPDPGAVYFETLQTPRRPRSGLAVGHSIDSKTGKTRLELRVSALAGPNRQLADRIAHDVRAQGVETVIKFVRPFMPIRSPIKKAHADLEGRREPLHIGASVAHEHGSAGTLGAFVLNDKNEIGILSCTHVLAWAGRKKVKMRANIHQPGPADQDQISALTRVGYLANFAPFVDVQAKNVDAAYAVLDRDINYVGNYLPKCPCVPKEFWNKPIGKTVAIDESFIGRDVLKIGRTTGYTKAKIGSLDYQNLSVEFGAQRSAFTFSGVLELLWDEDSEYAAAGDSGAIVLTLDGLHPVGLHFASGGKSEAVSYVVPWQRIRDTLGIQLA